MRILIIFLNCILITQFMKSMQINDQLNENLISASEKGNFELVKYYLKNGAYINTKDEFNNTPLHKAIRKKHKDIIKFLIENGADVNIATSISGYTSLHYIINTPVNIFNLKDEFEMRKEIIVLMLQHNADITIKNQFGDTPYQTANKFAEDRKKFKDTFLMEKYLELAKLIKTKEEIKK